MLKKEMKYLSMHLTGIFLADVLDVSVFSIEVYLFGKVYQARLTWGASGTEKCLGPEEILPGVGETRICLGTALISWSEPGTLGSHITGKDDTQSF